jgi:hypothetical protein
MAKRITLRKGVTVVYEGQFLTRTVTIDEIRVLKGNRPYSLYDKFGERYEFENLDEDSKKKINEIVERNKPYV